MSLFRRRDAPAPYSGPPIPAKEQRRLIRESDRRNYTAAGYRALTSYAFARDIVPGKLSSVIHDQLTDRDPPERSAVAVGVHDAELLRAVATVFGERYSKAALSLREFLPRADDTGVAGRQLRAVMLFWENGKEAERHRVRRVVASADEFAAPFSGVDEVRRRIVEERSSERLVTGHRVELALAASWTGRPDIVERLTRELDAELDPPARARLNEILSRT
jgi:hypothetical protein